MYFPDQPLNAVDLLLQRKSEQEQVQMIASAVGGENEYSWTIVMEKV